MCFLMKKSKLVLLALGFSFLGLGQTELGGYPKFNMWDHVSEEKAKKTMIKEGRTYLYIWYDLDKDTLIDALAVYNPLEDNHPGPDGEKNALFLYMGLDKKKIPDYVLTDDDENGTLESFDKGRYIRKGIRKMIREKMREEIESNKKPEYEV